MLYFLAAAPWILMTVIALARLRPRPRLASYSPREQEEDRPLVSVIVPARDERVNLGACVASIMGSSHEPLEIIVVDDGSTDGTGEIARELERRSDGQIRLVTGEPLPEGWFGKPWACWQGYLQARGEVLVFTDADTRHDADLISRCLAAMRRQRADLVSVVTHQELVSFWERVIMPHILLLISLRYLDIHRVNHARGEKDILANGQFILVDRTAYEEMGGHRAVRTEVVEDLRLAQRLHAAGRRIFLVHAESFIETRMYRSLSGIVEGWTKNLAIGSRLTVDPWLRPVLPWLLAALVLAFWLAPPAVIIASIFAGVGGGLLRWAIIANAAALLFWTIECLRSRIPVLYAVSYPLGAAATAVLFARSALRGTRVVWKGREYGAGGVESRRAPSPG